MSGLIRHRSHRSSGAAASPAVPGSLVLFGLALALVAAACSTSPATAQTDRVSEDCFLGLDLWDTDPALTWIEDGSVWVRTGDHQACLDRTDATSIRWGPDGRRLLLDGDLVAAGAETPAATVPLAQTIVWQQPFGSSLYSVDGSGSIALLAGDQSLTTAGAVLLFASHPDGKHLATVDAVGNVTLATTDGTPIVSLTQLDANETPIQMEFAADGSRLWVLTAAGTQSTVSYVDLLPLSDKLDIEPVESIVPQMELPIPELYFIDADRAQQSSAITTDIGATGTEITKFALHPAHRDWLAITEGRCAEAVSSLFLDGELAADDLPGAVVGFFRGGGEPILATTSAGGDCGTGQLWVVDGLPRTATTTLIADAVSSADIRDEAPDPWNPDTAPPFA